MISLLDDYTIPGSVLRLGSLIGKGSFGAVYQAHSILPPFALCAVKVICKTTPPVESLAHQEIRLHFRASQHQNVLPLLQTIESATFAFLVLPYVPNGTLADQIYRCHYFINNPSHIKPVFMQLLTALAFCHTNGIAHRDIKPENVLCGFDQVYISDFGLATDQAISNQLLCGTRAYMAPECLGSFPVLTARYNTYANDIWSLGIVFLNLVTSSQPWAEASNFDPDFCGFIADPTGLTDRYGLKLMDCFPFLLDVFVREDQRINVQQLLERLSLN